MQSFEVLVSSVGGRVILIVVKTRKGSGVVVSRNGGGWCCEVSSWVVVVSARLGEEEWVRCCVVVCIVVGRIFRKSAVAQQLGPSTTRRSALFSLPSKLPLSSRAWVAVVPPGRSCSVNWDSELLLLLLTNGASE